MDQAKAYAKKYTEDVLAFFGVNVEVEVEVGENDVIEIAVPSTELNGFLIGNRGETLRATQQLISTALNNQNFEYSRVSLDIADYKKQQADRLAEKAQAWIDSVKETSEPYSVRPMNAADRRTLHKVAAEAGLVSESVGEGRDRHIVLKPSND